MATNDFKVEMGAMAANAKATALTALNMTSASWWTDGAVGLCGTSVWSRFKFSQGDVSGFFQLAFDNLATILTLVGLLSYRTGFGLLTDDDIYGTVLPGLAISMVFGNLWYAWLGCRLSAKENRDDVTCQPYGINTPGSYAILFGVLLEVAFGIDAANCSVDTQDLPECVAKSKRVLQIGVAANLLQGMIAMGLGFVGPLVAKIAPLPSLYSALSGIGFAFLLVGQMSNTFMQPLSGLPAFFLMLIFFFGGVRTGRVPEAFVIALVGTSIAWMDGVVDGDGVDASTEHVKWQGATATWSDAFNNLGDASEYIGLILPVAIASAVSTLMCWRSAVDNGDTFPLRETMIVDGLGSMVAALFGCPFGTSVYVGHGAYKRVGARSGYSVMNAAFFLLLSLFGLLALVQAIIPIYAVAPLIAFVGLMIVSDSIEQLPLRHAPALMLGIVPAVADWAANNCSLADSNGDSCFVNTNPVGAGLKALQNSYLMNSMMLTAIFTLVIDRKFLSASIWTVAAAFLSLFGIMHQAEINADFDEGGDVSKWRFAVGYLIVASFLVIFWLQQKFASKIGFLGGMIDPPVTDEQSYMTCGEALQIAQAHANGTQEVPKPLRSHPSAVVDLEHVAEIASNSKPETPLPSTFSSAA